MKRNKLAVLQRLICLVALLVGTTAAGDDRTTMREILDGYIKDRSPVFYNYEFDRDWFYNSSEIVIKGNQFETAGFGGIYSRESTHKIAAALLKAPFTFLMPEQLDSLLTSKPRTKCPVLDPKELYRPPASKK